MKRSILLHLVMAVLAVGFFSFAQAADFPEKDLSGIIQWGAGGGTDNVARAVTPLVEKYLGKQIVLQNKPGATGAVAVQWVHNQAADGYTLLYGAENPTLYKVLDISQLDYKDFEPIIILCRGIGVVTCNVNAPWKTLNDLFADAKSRPGVIKMGSTGPGGLAHVASCMMKAVDGVTFNHIVFPGDGPVSTAMMGGHIQVSTPSAMACRENIRAGRVRALAVIADEPVAGLEDVPLITKDHPQYKKFLPWGYFFGVWVKKNTPAAAREKLVAAFKKGSQEPKFQELLKNIGAVYMGISGAEAEKYIAHYQSVTTWLLHDAEATKASPAKFGIPKP